MFDHALRSILSRWHRELAWFVRTSERKCSKARVLVLRMRPRPRPSDGRMMRVISGSRRGGRQGASCGCLEIFGPAGHPCALGAAAIRLDQRAAASFTKARPDACLAVTSGATPREEHGCGCVFLYAAACGGCAIFPHLTGTGRLESSPAISPPSPLLSSICHCRFARVLRERAG